MGPRAARSVAAGDPRGDRHHAEGRARDLRPLEERDFTVQTDPNPGMLYDYGGFPDFTYRIQYPAPGSPDVAARVSELLDGAGIANRSDPRRGFDHGTFVPPAFLVTLSRRVGARGAALSLRVGYDPAAHLAVGRALAPLRDEGVLIVGSGFSFHNLRLIFNGGAGCRPSSTPGSTATATNPDPEARLSHRSSTGAGSVGPHRAPRGRITWCR